MLLGVNPATRYDLTSDATRKLFDEAKISPDADLSLTNARGDLQVA